MVFLVHLLLGFLPINNLHFGRAMIIVFPMALLPTLRDLAGARATKLRAGRNFATTRVGLFSLFFSCICRFDMAEHSSIRKLRLLQEKREGSIMLNN